MILRSIGTGVLLGLALLHLGGCRPASEAPAIAVSPAAWEITGMDGSRQVVQPGPETRAIVFEFLGTECPISNRVQPELSRLADEFSPLGVRFITVYPNVGESADGIRRHRAEASFFGEIGLDPLQKLAGQLEASVTPEVVVLAANGALIYRGRVNDQYAGLGQGKPAPTRHDLEEALRTYVVSGVATGIQTAPAGCRIQRAP